MLMIGVSRGELYRQMKNYLQLVVGAAFVESGVFQIANLELNSKAIRTE